MTIITGSNNKNKLKSNIKNRINITRAIKKMIQALIPVTMNILKVMSQKYKNYSQK